MVFAAEGEQKPDEKKSGSQWKPLLRRVSVADLGTSSLWTRIMLLVRVRVRVRFKLIFSICTWALQGSADENDPDRLKDVAFFAPKKYLRPDR